MLKLKLIAMAAALAVLAPVGSARGASDEPLTFAPKGVTTDRFPAATTFQRVEVAAHDGVILSSRVYRPDTSSDPEWKTPVILVHSPYYDPAATSARSKDLVSYFTPKGYAVVLSEVRGTGNSGGCLEQDGPNQARDFKTLVEHFAREPWSSGKVASYGKSYDAETQNAGAVLDPDGLETMITVAGISSLYDVAYFDAVPLNVNGLLSAAVYLPTGMSIPQPLDPIRVAQRPGCHVDNFVWAVDPRGDETQYWKDRNFRYGVKKIEASVLYVHGLSDFTVSPIALDGWYDELPTFKRAIIGQWAHFYPYDAPNSVARLDWYDTVHAWLDHELLDLDSGVGAWPPMQVQDERNVWRWASSFAEMGVPRPVPLGNASLGAAGPSGATVAFAERTAASFDGPKLDAQLHLSGQAVLNARIAIDRPDAHFAVTLQEVRADGSTRTLTRGYLSAMHRGGRVTSELVPLNQAIDYRIRTYPFDKVVAAGSSLRLVVAGSDGSSLPAGTAYNGTITVDGASMLTLPVVESYCGILVARKSSGAEVPGCPVELD